VEKVRGEWALVCTTHNLLKLNRLITALKAANRANRPEKGTALRFLR